MAVSPFLKSQLKVRDSFGLQFVAFVVAAHGSFVLAVTLIELIAGRHVNHLSNTTVDLSIIIGLSLLYLSVLLRRLKRTAWLATVMSYVLYLGLNLSNLIRSVGMDDLVAGRVMRVVILPVSILTLLVVLRSHYTVRSDIQGFRAAVRTALLVIVVAFMYGVAGFSLLDKSDFHQEITPVNAARYTVDQFYLTSNKPLVPATRRARLFTESLSVISLGAALYAAAAFFQPIRLRYIDQTHDRRRLAELLAVGGGRSEDYFKLWPHDKQFFFNEAGSSGLAYHVRHGVALCLGDPAGATRSYGKLVTAFGAVCAHNDWLPAFVHIEPTHRQLYVRHGYSLQKIGQEAVVDIAHFQAEVVRNKYFRHINNKFTKLGYRTDLLVPPHDAATLRRLRTVSDEWLSQGGRTERGFVMGYFSADYMQQCPIMVVRDSSGEIQAFLNQLPADFDTQEATYDLLRHSDASPGNINDFLLLNFIGYLSTQTTQRINLGLCPLAGLDKGDETKTVVDSILRFVYANGDRLYSFSGLRRFKSKYEPTWRDRYVAYQGGLRGLTRTTNALVSVMRVKRP
ncbi:MAG: phosphatidylglycerol lysyltransferase domain-containing protein [Candidatus Saccharibacteria bacterium]